jgi:regulator of protease activity HflC (stomatin/prohibitin superfamily)
MLDKLIDFLIQCIKLFQFWVVIEPFEQAVILRLGKLYKTIECGFHWVLPFGIDNAINHPIVPSTHDLGDTSTTSKDGKSMGYNAIVTYRVSSIQKAVLEVEDVNHAVRDACSGEIGRVLRSLDWKDMQGQECLEALTAACRKRGWRFGIEIMSVQLAGLTLCKSLRLMNHT